MVYSKLLIFLDIIRENITRVTERLKITHLTYFYFDEEMYKSLYFFLLYFTMFIY